VADPRSKRRHLPAQRDEQHAGLAPTAPNLTEPGTRQVGQQPTEERGLNWPWLLADRGILIVACLVAGLGVLGLITMWLIANRLHGVDRANLQIDAIKYGLGFIAAGGAAAGLLLGVRRQQLAERSHDLELRKQELERRKQEHTEADAADRRITELYAKAVEQLGSADAAVRLGGLYALERVAQNNPDQRQTIVDVICAYLRMPYMPPTKPNPAQQPDAAPAGPIVSTAGSTASTRDPRQELQVRLTAQRILTNHLRRPDDVLPADLDSLEVSPSRLFWPRTDLDITGATLVNWTFDECAVRSSRFDEASFVGDASFSRAAFTGDASFGEATFGGSASFGEATFVGDVSFSRVTFAGDAYFGEVTFGGSASFGLVTFGGNALFGEAAFGGNASFDRATFVGNVSLSEAAFVGDVSFGGATFTSGSSFNKATFKRAAHFREVTFAGDAYFGEVTFAREVSFEQVSFIGNARFDGARHRNGAYAFGFDGSRITNRERRLDRWPEGWSVRPGSEYSTLQYMAAEPQPSTGAERP